MKDALGLNKPGDIQWASTECQLLVFRGHNPKGQILRSLGFNSFPLGPWGWPSLGRPLEFCTLHQGAPFLLSPQSQSFPSKEWEGCGWEGELRQHRVEGRRQPRLKTTQQNSLRLQAKVSGWRGRPRCVTWNPPGPSRPRGRCVTPCSRMEAAGAAALAPRPQQRTSSSVLSVVQARAPPPSRSHLTRPPFGSPPPSLPGHAALTWEPSPGSSITPGARPAATPAQTGGRGSPACTLRAPLAHFRIAPRPRSCARPRAANPRRRGNPRPLSHGGGAFSSLGNGRSCPALRPAPAMLFPSAPPLANLRFPFWRPNGFLFRLLFQGPGVG